FGLPLLKQLLVATRLLSGSSGRSKFDAPEPPQDKPDWLKVGWILGTSIFLCVYLIKRHNEDVVEYKKRNGLE
uniref:NADH dehydrogenase [ubiquinone] 1 subunit C1, mitochondrial n=1 Tax=Rhinolophus ferrumequinum TaxID=59479 RepID=A0A671F560_RHIFE